jgi:PAS domain S-box-containing protein
MKSDDNSGRHQIRDEGGLKKAQSAPPGKGALIEQANLRTDKAPQKTVKANIRAKKTETLNEALGVSESSYRRLFETAKDGILILDADTGRVTDVNPFLTELLGFSREETVGKTVGELSPFKDVVANQDILERLQKDGYVRYHNLPLETKDGRQIAVEFVSNVYQAGDKKVIQCNIRDIAERKQAEEIHARLVMGRGAGLRDHRHHRHQGHDSLCQPDV